MDILGQLTAVAAFVERAVQFVKSVVKYNEFAARYQAIIDQVLVLGINVGLCYYWQVDVFAAAGLALPLEWLGSVLTGVFAALGSGVIHELFELLKLVRYDRKNEYL